jgi:hypothetical protein
MSMKPIKLCRLGSSVFLLDVLNLMEFRLVFSKIALQLNLIDL